MEQNCFFCYFAARRDIGGVELIADDRVGALSYPMRAWPAKWTTSALANPSHVGHDAAEIAQANRLVASGIDLVEPTVVFNQWLDASPPRESVRQFLMDLRPIRAIADEAQLFWDTHIGEAPAVAIHIRHGNGENLGSRAAYWLGPIALIKQLTINARNDLHKSGISGRYSDNMPVSFIGASGQADYERRFSRNVARAFSSFAMPNAVPLLFTDAPHIIGLMRESLPTVIEKQKHEFKRGEGPLHQVNSRSMRGQEESVRSNTVSNDIVFDMFVELELMRRCSGLVFMDSGFSLLARASLDQSRLRRLRPTLTNRIISRMVERMLKGSTGAP